MQQFDMYGTLWADHKESVGTSDIWSEDFSRQATSDVEDAGT